MPEWPAGVLDPRAGEGRFALALHAPAPDLAWLVEQHWIVEWDLAPGERHVQETLPSPNVNLVFEGRPAGVYGVQTRRFARTLDGRGRAHGVKFRAGSFHALLRRPVAALTDRRVDIPAVLGPAGARAERELEAVADHAERVRRAEALVRAAAPAGPDRYAAVATDVVAAIAADRSIRRVDHLVAVTGLQRRALQRLFHRHVGVGPKWVIRRFRLLEALERATAGEPVGWAALAVDLGYADQAHLTREFRALVGHPPAAYAVRAS
jgi:AraC-like DNA-binding protein